MSGYSTGNNPNLYDGDTGDFVGVIGLRGQEQLIATMEDLGSLSASGYPVVTLSTYCACDGTTDDTAGFALALAATPVGGSLYLGPAGTTVLVRTAAGFSDRCINLDDWDDRRMFGGATIKIANDVISGRTVMRGHLHRSTFEGFTIDGNVVARAPGAYGPEGEGFNPKDSTHLTVIGVTVRDTHQDGFDFDDCDDCLLYRCSAYNTWGDGYHMGGTVGALNNRVVIKKCYSENCGHVRRLADSFGAGFSMGGENNSLIDCVSYLDQRGVFWFTNDGKICGNTVIDARTDASNGDVGIDVGGGGYGNIVTGNIVTNGSKLTGSIGINVADERNTVSHNFLKNLITGVQVAAKRNNIIGNLTSGATNGVLTLNTVTGPNTIRGNHFNTCSYGVRADGAATQIVGNTVYTSTEHGFDIRASNCTVSGNDVIDGAKYGCRLFSAAVLNCIITNNNFAATTGGVSIAGTGHVTAANVVNGVMVP